LDVPLHSPIIASIDWNVSLIPLIISSGILLLLLFGSALAAASEVSFFSLTPDELSDLENQSSKSAKHAAILLQQPKNLLAAFFTANNFLHVSIVIIGAYITSIFLAGNLAHPFWMLMLDVAILTTIIMLFGEVLPKYYASKHGIKVIHLMATPIFLFSKIPPFNWMIKALVSGTEMMSKVSRDNALDETSSELSHALELSKDDDSDNRDQKILHDIVRFGKKDVNQIMRSRNEVSAANIELNYTKLQAMIVASGFSRIPVYRGSFDTIEGILFVKDLLPHLNETENFNWQKLVREPFFVLENEKIDDLLKTFQGRKVHMAIVVNEVGKNIGIVTLEDVLEEIVGDITDEFDNDHLTYSKLDKDNYVFEGKLLLTDLYKILETDGREFEHVKAGADTIGNFILTLTNGKVPQRDEKISFQNYIFTLESVENRRIKRVKLTRIKTDETIL
jgi:gliding motility-associated protein GldE